jgi:hypothetical protein
LFDKQRVETRLFYVSRRELLTAQNENFQLEKKIHELQMNAHNPAMASTRLSDIANGPPGMGLPTGSSAPATPNVARRYYEMKYGDKVASSNVTPSNTNNPNSSIYTDASSFGQGSSNMTSVPVRNGSMQTKGSPLPSAASTSNVNTGPRTSATFNLRNKLPNSIQNTLASTSQSLQSKLPASLQKLPASLTQGPTMNMLANKFQNAFS